MRTPVAGTDPTGTDPTGANPTGTDPTGTASRNPAPTSHRFGGGGKIGKIGGIAGILALVLVGCTGSAVDEGGDGGTGDGGTATPDESAPTADDTPVVVGLVNPLTGPFAALGEDVNAGFEAYLDSRDGVLSGHPVEVLTEDTANDTATAQEAVARLVDDGADMLAGLVNSGVANGVSSTVVDAGVPLMITTAGADALTQRDAVDTIFRLSYTSSQDAMPLGDWACNELGHETVAIIGLDYAFGWEAASGFAKVYEDAGCDVIQEVYAPLGTADWAPFVQQLDTDADAVWAVIPGADGIRFMQAYRDFGLELPLLGHGATTDEQILPEQGDTALGAVTTLHYSAAIDSPENAELTEAFEGATGTSVSQYAEHGWAAAMVLEAALAAIDGDITPEALVDAIGAVQVDAPRGPLSFDEFGQAIHTVYVREVQEVDGELVNAIIDEYPETSQFWTYDPEEFLSGTPLGDLRGTWE